MRACALLATLAIFAALALGGCASEESQPQAPNAPQAPASPSDHSALVPNQLAKTQVARNPYLPDSESSVHNDVYNSDVTAAVLPLGIYPEIAEATAAGSAFAPPTLFYDALGNAIMPYNEVLDDGTVLSGGIAIRDANSTTLDVLGSYLPALDDTEGGRWGLQISYAFVDAQNFLVGPASNGHVVMIQTTDDSGNVLPKFKKALDVDIVGGAVAALGQDVSQSLLSVAYDYEGNLWFVSGGFHMNPAHSQAGYCGYLERAYIDATLDGSVLDAADYLHYLRFSDGENVENGIAAHPSGCVILTNAACLLLHADAEAGVVEDWRVPYESSGGKAADPARTGITGCGLAWGGGSSPTLTDELAIFLDNQDVVNLHAVEIATGKLVASTPVLDLGEDVIVSVENSVSVYAPTPERASVLVCNWYGAGAAALFEPGSDSSVQSYDNLYDAAWRTEGSAALMPGVERVDVVRAADGSYFAETVWTRADLKDTSMIKLSTGAGYYYGYTQDESTGEWAFFALDFDTGETLLWVPVSTEAAYNNIAVGIMQAEAGNALFCPTDSPVLLCLRDRFAYATGEGAAPLDITAMTRRSIGAEEFQAAGGAGAMAASYVLSACAPALDEGATLAFRVNGLSGNPADYAAYCLGEGGAFAACADALIVAEGGGNLAPNEALDPATIYEVSIPLHDAAPYDLDPAEGAVKVSLVLATSA